MAKADETGIGGHPERYLRRDEALPADSIRKGSGNGTQGAVAYSVAQSNSPESASSNPQNQSWQPGE
jgi:hypothetical protein